MEKRIWKCSEREYDSLRNEIICRMESINHQANTAIITILSTWTIGFALFVSINTPEPSSNHIISLICALIFLVPVYYFIPLAVKSGENIQQIASISAYIRVFFEYNSAKNNGENFVGKYQTIYVAL